MSTEQIVSIVIGLLVVYIIALTKKVYQLEHHLDAVLPMIMSSLTEVEKKVKYLEHRQAPHTFNETVTPTKPGL